MKLSYRVRLATVAVAAAGFGAVVPVSTAVAQVAPDVSAQAGSACPRSELPVPVGYTSASLASADPSGRFQVGTARDAEDRTHLLRWDGGVVSDLATRGLAFGPTDVNAGGEIAGGDYDEATGRYVGWRYRDGEFVSLPGRAPYVDVSASAINAAGQIAGRVDDPATGRTLPAVWNADNSLTVLGMPSDRNTVTVQDIDEDGTVLGTVWYDDGNTGISGRSAIVWYPDGTWRLLAGLESGAETNGTSIRSGRVIGLQVSGSTAPILIWDAATGEVSTFRGGATGNPTAINADGSVTGYLDGVAGPVFVAAGAEPRSLPINDPVMGSGGPAALTDDDVAYGNDYDENGTAVVRWNCQG
ncbi:hypothetical protein [Flindersiella endophytica]